MIDRRALLTPDAADSDAPGAAVPGGRVADSLRAGNGRFGSRSLRSSCDNTRRGVSRCSSRFWIQIGRVPFHDRGPALAHRNGGNGRGLMPLIG